MLLKNLLAFNFSIKYFFPWWKRGYSNLVIILFLYFTEGFGVEVNMDSMRTPHLKQLKGIMKTWTGIMILVLSLQFPMNHPMGESLLPLPHHLPLPTEVANSSFVFCHVTFFFPRSVVTFDRVFCKVINLKTSLNSSTNGFLLSRLFIISHKIYLISVKRIACKFYWADSINVLFLYHTSSDACNSHNVLI